MPHPVMLFAAGFGTRMGALTANCPKPLVEVAGRALIDHALAMVEQAGAGPIVVNLHYLGGMIRSHLAGSPILFSDETGEILETGGGLRQALPLLGSDPVITVNPDVLWQGDNPITLLQQAWDPSRMDGLMMLVPKERAHAYKGQGDFLLGQNGQLRRGAGAIYGGVQILKTDGLAKISQSAFSLNLLWDQMLAEGRLFGLVYQGHWCDIGHPEGIPLAEALLEAHDV